MTVSRVALQAATAQLSALKLFADSNGLLIAHSGVKIGSFTRDISTASGTQTITGVGFQPQAVIFIASVPDSFYASVGFDNAVTHASIFNYPVNVVGHWNPSVANSIAFFVNGAPSYVGYTQSMDADGFTLNWTKSGLPTGTAYIIYLALR
jgi:hypothetical protein